MIPVDFKKHRVYFIYMRLYKIPSVFVEKNTIFYYSAYNKKTDKAILILKGLYGKHIPSDNKNKDNKQSWENQLISMLKNEYNVFIFNTGRHNTDDKKEAFAGKTYLQECEDVQQSFMFCKKNT